MRSPQIRPYTINFRIRKASNPILFQRMASSNCLPIMAVVFMFMFIYLVQQFDTLEESTLASIVATSANIQREQSRALLVARQVNSRTLANKFSLTSAKHDLLKSSQYPKVFAFFSPWCGHCQHFIPQFVLWGEKSKDLGIL